MLWKVLARAPATNAEEDKTVLHAYFNLHESLAARCKEWAAADQRFKLIYPHFRGKSCIGKLQPEGNQAYLKGCTGLYILKSLRIYSFNDLVIKLKK